jgi:hypothetical protein
MTTTSEPQGIAEMPEEPVSAGTSLRNDALRLAALDRQLIRALTETDYEAVADTVEEYLPLRKSLRTQVLELCDTRLGPWFEAAPPVRGARPTQAEAAPPAPMLSLDGAEAEPTTAPTSA